MGILREKELEAQLQRRDERINELERQLDVSRIEITEELRNAVIEAVAGALGDAYDCMRVWSAWGCGTMSQDDFSLVAEDESRLDEIADAAIGAMTANAGVTGA